MVVALAGAGVGMVLIEARRVSRGVGWAGVALVVVIVAALVPPALSRARAASGHPRPAGPDGPDRQALDGGGVARRAGALQACGEPLTRLEYQTILAWTLHVNVATVGYSTRRPSPAAADRPVHAHLARRLARAGAASAPRVVPVAAGLGHRTPARPPRSLARTPVPPPPADPHPTRKFRHLRRALSLMTENSSWRRESGISGGAWAPMAEISGDARARGGGVRFGDR